MAFLDNSGDIILDAVLTDTGRLRMAQGTFRIQKFALGDDEIDYGLFNKSQPTGQQDLDILGTPILEAFTDNASGLKSKLLTIGGEERLYLPVLKLHNEGTSQTRNDGAYYIAVNQQTKEKFATDKTGVMTYFQPSDGADFDTVIEVHQGIDNAEKTDALSADLIENQYIVEIDNLLGSVYNADNAQKAVSYIDDDNIASYFLYKEASSEGTEVKTLREDAGTIAGAPGTKLTFRIKPQDALKGTSDVWFERLGGEVSITTDTAHTFYYVDATVKVMGVTTGYRLDIPVRFLKWKSTP